MKLYAVYIGDGRFVNLRGKAGSWVFGLEVEALSTDESYARYIFRRMKKGTNRYNPEGWPKLELRTYELELIDTVQDFVWKVRKD
jgi:hypothetical protein